MSSTGITLFASNPMLGLPDSSPFVIKTEVQLKMAGLTYDKVSTTPPQAPNGKLPYINDHDPAGRGFTCGEGARLRALPPRSQTSEHGPVLSLQTQVAASGALKALL